MDSLTNILKVKDNYLFEIENKPNDVISYRKLDTYQYMISCLITSNFFPWLLLLLVLKRKWNRYFVIIILILHWLLKSIAFALKGAVALDAYNPNNQYPYTMKNFHLICIANAIYFIGDIIGDWYPLIRTKSMIIDNKSLWIVYITCFVYNISKIVVITSQYLYMPMDIRIYDEKGNKVTKLMKMNMTYSMCQIASILISIFYDLSVIYVLKKNFFDHFNNIKTIFKNSFIEKFIMLSEYRVYISMIFSILFFICYTIYFTFTYYCYIKDVKYRKESINTIVANIYYLYCNINYTIMYIDQVLIKYYSDETSTVNILSLPNNSILNEFHEEKEAMLIREPNNNHNINSFQPNSDNFNSIIKFNTDIDKSSSSNSLKYSIS